MSSGNHTLSEMQGGCRSEIEASKTDNRVARQLRRLISVLILLALGVAVFQQRRALVSALSMDLSILLLITAATLGSWLLNALGHRLLLGALGTPLPVSRLFALHVGGGFMNYLPFRAGTLYRAQYLKNRAELPYARFGSFLLTNTVLAVAATGVLGAVTVVVTYGFSSRSSLALGGLLALLAVVSIAILVVPLGRWTSGSWTAGRIQDLEGGRDLIVGSPFVLGGLLLIHALLFVLAAIRMVGAFISLQMQISIPAAMVLGAASMLSVAVSITPGGLGIQEFVVASTSTVLGISFSAGLVAAAVLRTVLMGLSIAVGIPSLLWLRRR